MSKLSVRVPDGVPRVGQPDGWYPDPIGKPVRRLWSGQRWTEWVSDGTGVGSDPLPNRWIPRADDAGHLEFVERVFLPEVGASGTVTPEQMFRLTGLTHSMAERARRFAAAPTEPTLARTDPRGTVYFPIPPTRPAAPPPLRGALPPVVVTRLLPAPPAPIPSAAPPSIVSKWWTRTRDGIGSDLAVHGLAYVGVLLFFVGAVGLVVFAFGDVAPNLRPAAEIVIASAPFLAAALLLQRGAFMVGRALEVAGGLVLPVMVITAFLDGFVFPPDLDGPATVMTLTACCAAIGLGYALWSRWHPASGLRFLVAPMAWLTTAMATLGLDRAIPVGKAVATPGGAQTAAIAACLVITLVLARWRPKSFLAAPTLIAALPGTLVVGVLALLTWVAEGWPAAQIFASGALLLGALELLRPRLPAAMDVVEPLWWAVVGVALVPGLGGGPAAAVAVVGFILLVEVAGAKRPSALAITVPLVGAVTALTAVWADPVWAAVIYGAATGWALTRRLAPFAVPGSDSGLDLAAAVLPAGFVVAIGLATDLQTAVACGAGLVLLATVPATRPVLHRNTDDRFWTFWWTFAVMVVAAAAWVGGTTASTSIQNWLLTGSVVVLALASGFGPIPPVWRVWPVLGLGTCAWLMTCSTAELSVALRGCVLGIAALALVVGAHLRRSSPAVGLTQDPVRAGVGLAGHVVAMLSLGAAGGLGWAAVAVTGLATTGWAITTAFDARDRSPVGAALAQVGEALRYLPPGFVALGIPFTVAMVLDVSGWLPMGAPRASAVLAATAVGYGVACRLPVQDRIVGTLVWGGFVAGLGASLTSDPGAAALGLGALIVAVLLVPARRRVALQTWVAWAAVAPMLGLAAEEWLPWLSALPVMETISITLVAVGGTLLIGAAVADLRFGPWEPHYAPRRTALRPPVLLGGLEIVAGLLVALTTLPTVTAGWLTAVVAAVALATGMLAAAGLLAGVGIALGWLAALLVIGPDLDSWPLIGLLVVTILLAAAELLHRIVPEGSWWSRWDLSLLVVAAPIALTTLGAAAGRGPDPFAVTSVLLGALCWAVAVRLRHRRSVLTTLGLVGTGLVLAGAAVAGSGWLALSLMALAVALTVVAARTDDVTRRLFAVGGALVAFTAWLSALNWFGWGAQPAVDVTAVGAGVVVVAASGLAWVRALDRSWVLIWGGSGVVAAMICVVLAEQGQLLPGQLPAPSPPIAVGLVLVTAALLLAARPLEFGCFRDLSVAGGFGAALVAYQSSDLPAGAWVTVLVLVSTACAVVALALRDRPNQVWQRPVLELGVAAVAGAISVAALQLPEVPLLVAGLVAAAVQAAAFGVVLGSIAVQALSPVLACAAWLAYASELLGGNPQWSTVSIGLAMLVVVALLRHDRSVHDGSMVAPQIVTLEFVGIGFLVGASFVQAVAESLLYTMLALALGLLIAAWGLVTRVRRRLAAGAVVGLAALVLLVAVPLVRLLPELTTAALWVLILGLGLIILVLATLFEKGRNAVRKNVVGFEMTTADWE